MTKSASDRCGRSRTVVLRNDETRIMYSTEPQPSLSSRLLRLFVFFSSSHLAHWNVVSTGGVASPELLTWTSMAFRMYLNTKLVQAQVCFEEEELPPAAQKGNGIAASLHSICNDLCSWAAISFSYPWVVPLPPPFTCLRPLPPPHKLQSLDSTPDSALPIIRELVALSIRASAPPPPLPRLPPLPPSRMAPSPSSSWRTPLTPSPPPSARASGPYSMPTTRRSPSS